MIVLGVTQKGMRGIPSCVKQEEMTNRVAQIEARDTVKVAVLIRDDECPNLVATSFYDTKPVHLLSMLCKVLK